MTLDVTKAISAKSDQQNAEDYLAGPRTIKITEVNVNNGQEQPIHISFEGDDGKVWKPCKTAARTLAAIWGADASAWIGLSCTIYCDPDVTWGGMRVGGIRVSHMEGLTQPRTLMLTKTRGKKGATVIKPLVIASTPHETDLVSEFEASKTMTPEEKSAWWKSKTADEKAKLKAMAEMKQ